MLHPTAGPRFCSVDAADVTGDGAPDLFFADYDSGGQQIFDFDNRLLINDGTGHFFDDSGERLAPEVAEAAFGMSSEFADMNGDGLQDIVKLSTLSAPLHVGIAYNSAATTGYFQSLDVVYQLAPYHLAAHDMNGDGRLDIVVSDHGQDRLLVNTGNDEVDQAVFVQVVIPETGNMGGNIGIGDLDRDGRPDLVLTDVEVDIPGCNRTTYIKQNLSTVDQIAFAEDDVIPAEHLTGLHDVAILDIDGDGWLDMVFGRCNGLEVWMNEPIASVDVTYPDGIPEVLPPGLPHDLYVVLQPEGVDVVEAVLWASPEHGIFDPIPLKHAGGNLYVGQLPADSCPGDLRFTVEVVLSNGNGEFDPPGGFEAPYVIAIGTDTELVVDDDMEQPSGWSVESTPSLTAGAWELAVPNGTFYGGAPAAPGEDATPGDGTMCFVTGNGPPAGEPGANDVDSGTTSLVSPPFELGGANAVISFKAWFATFNGQPDQLTVSIGDGTTWNDVLIVAPTEGDWIEHSILLSEALVPPGDALLVRFDVGDDPNDSITEAGIDDFTVELIECGRVSRRFSTVTARSASPI